MVVVSVHTRYGFVRWLSRSMGRRTPEPAGFCLLLPWSWRETHQVSGQDLWPLLSSTRYVLFLSLLLLSVADGETPAGLSCHPDVVSLACEMAPVMESGIRGVFRTREQLDGGSRLRQVCACVRGVVGGPCTTRDKSCTACPVPCPWCGWCGCERCG